MNTLRTFLCSFPLLLVLYQHSVEAVTTVQVSPCSESRLGDEGGSTGWQCIDPALAALEDNSVLQLQRGRHHLLISHNLTALSDITIRGTGASPEDTSITCERGVGLEFILASNLTIENVEINGCGVDTSSTYAAVSHHVDQVFRTASPFQVALIFCLCENVTMRDVAIHRANGTGLVSYNTMGSFTLSGVQISDNIPQTCTPTVDDIDNSHLSNNPSTVLGPIGGGGATILYNEFLNGKLSSKYKQDTVHLTVTNSLFFNNTECSLTDFTAGYLSAAFLADIHYLSGGGGGLSLLLSQQSFSIKASIDASSFIKNTARFGSGAYLLLFEGITGNEISFNKCHYHNNSYMFSKMAKTESDQGGGGIAIFEDVQNPSRVKNHVVGIGKANCLSFDNCTFQNNLGIVGGAIHINSFHLSKVPLNILLHNCLLQQNQAIIGAVLYVHDSTDSYRASKLNMTLANSSVAENMVKTFPDIDVSNPTGLSGIVSLQYTKLLLEGDVEFTSNRGTAVVARDALLTINRESEVTFSSNQADYGGGLRLISYSYLLMDYNSTASFTDNSASSSGGAIYTDATTLTTTGTVNGVYDLCFLHLINISFFCTPAALTGPLKCPNISNTRVQLKFTNNTSPLASLVYGSTLSTCPWAAPLTHTHPSHSVYQILYTYYDDVFMADKLPAGIEEVATQSVYLNLTYPSSLTTLSPGEQIPLTVFTYDKFGQPVPADVYSRSNNPQVTAYLADSLGTNGTGEIEYLKLLAPNEELSVQVSIVSADTSAQQSLELTIKPCELGFIYAPQNNTCVCSNNLTNVGVSCMSSSSSWIVPDGFWIGPSSDNSNDSSLVILRCFEDVCREGAKEVFPGSGDFSVQCREGYNRAGIGCGQCAENYSAILGSNQCKQCTDSSLFLLFLIAFLGVFTVALIFVMAILNFTISDGYINGILFFANIVNYYVQNLYLEYPFSLVLAPVAWISLNVGVPACFQSNLSPLLHAFYELLFPIYLVIVVAVLASLLHCFKWPAKLGLSTVNTLATTLIIIYSTISAACFRIMASTTITYVDKGGISIRWAGDPSVHYFQGAHGALAFFAIVLILLYVIPYPIFLLFPAHLYKTRLTRYFIPLYDAFWNPFKPRYRFWLGLRLLYRQIPFFLAVFVPTPLNLFIVALTLLLLLYLQLTLRPFKGVYRNALDSFFIMSMIALFLGPVLFRTERPIEPASSTTSIVSTLVGFHRLEINTSIYSVVLLTLTYLVCCGVVAYYVVMGAKRCYHHYTKQQKGTNELSPVDAENIINSPTENEVVTIKIQEIAAKQATYSVLREPLLEDGSISLVSVTPTGNK